MLKLNKCSHLFIIAALLFTGLLTSCTKGERKSFNIDSEWKVNFSDNMSFAEPDYDDSSWQISSSTGPQKFKSKDQHYLWLRKTVEIPPQLRNEEVYLGFDKGNAVAAVYADGTYIGSRGNLPPDFNCRIEQTSDILIPSNCIHNNTVNLAVRVYSPETDFDPLGLSLDSEAQAFFQNIIHNIFSMRIFIILTAVCFFMMVFVITQYVSTKDISFLFFALCLLFIIYYFYDLGFDMVLISYPLHRALTRACLPLSMSFMGLFLAAFFKRKKIKVLAIIMAVVDVLIVFAYLLSIGNYSLTNTIFTIGLGPTFGVIIYGYVVIIKAFKQKLFGARQLFVGFIGGSLFAFHDIICQILGYKPFVWLQGFAFFFIDLAIYISLSQKAGANQKAIIQLADETSKQKDKLTEVFKNAKAVAGSTAEISHSLNDSVSAVTNAADATQDKVEQIRRALDLQNKSQNETEKAIDNLTSFLSAMNSRFEEQAKLISSTAEKTREVIKGLETVGDGVNTAAQFSSGLSAVTKTSSNDMKNLLDEMEKVQASSKEILGVVTTLDDFAQQTNLLAMNASIEAAHAGETGKGFAVIAREIKELASQTSQWSAKIGEIITTVISQIQHSVELSTKVNSSLQKINKDSIESARKVGQASDSIREQQAAGHIISEESKTLSEIAKTMQNAVSEQSNFAKIVMQNMQSLIEASEDVDKASREIYSESKSLADESKNLIDLAQRTNESSETLTSIMEQ